MQAAGSAAQGQFGPVLPPHTTNGMPPTPHSSATLDRILMGRQLRHARQPSPQAALANESSLGYLNTAFASPSMWQQDGVQPRAASPSFGARGHTGRASGSYMAASQDSAVMSRLGGSQSGQFPAHRALLHSENSGTDASASAPGWHNRDLAGSQGVDPLHSAQGDCPDEL